MSDVIKQRQLPDFSDGAPWFAGTFEALRKVMKEMESHSSSNISSRPGTSESGGSASSKHENNIVVLGQNMLSDFLRVSGASLQYISWDPENLMFDARLCSHIHRTNT
jgi:hypothetical protein